MDAATILNRFGIPWPDADSDKARQAGAAWYAIANAANDAQVKSGTMVTELSANNSGPAMNAFTQYWSTVAGTPECSGTEDAKAMLPVLMQAADALSSACYAFAKAVQDAKDKLVEVAAEIVAAIASGAIATVFTAGVSDYIAEGASSLAIQAGLDAATVLGTSVEDILNGLATGALTGMISSVLDAGMNNSIKALDPSDTSADDTNIGVDLLEGMAFGGLAGAAGKVVVGAAQIAAESALNHLPDSVAALIPDLPTVINAIPGAAATAAGQTLTKLTTDYAAKSALEAAQGKDIEPPPGIPEILGELLDSKIEAAGDAEGG